MVDQARNVAYLLIFRYKILLSYGNAMLSEIGTEKQWFECNQRTDLWQSWEKEGGKNFTVVRDYSKI